MPLQLLPMEQEDLQAFYDVLWEATKHDLGSVMYPNGNSQADKDFSIKQNIKDWGKHSERDINMKIIDTDLPDDDPHRKFVGGAKWVVYRQERSDEQMEADRKEFQDQGLPPGMNAAFVEHFFGTTGKLKKEIMGNKAYVYLGLLFTRPDYWRKGVGSMHLKYGLDIADELGLPAYLEASAMGRPLYERKGFEFVKAIPLDVKEWGADHESPHACLFRPARAVNGEPK